MEGVEREQNAENELGIGGSAQEEKMGVVAMVVVVGELEGADIDRVKIVLGFDPLKYSEVPKGGTEDNDDDDTRGSCGGGGGCG